MKTNFFSKFVLATAVVFVAGALATSSADAGKTSSASGVNVTASLGTKHGGVGISASKSTAESTGKKKGADSTAGGGYIAGGGKFGCNSFGFAGGISSTSASAH